MPVAPIIQTDIGYIQNGVNTLSEKRKFFIESIWPTLKAGQDYFEIDGKKSISKGGAERLAEIFNLTAIFLRDTDTLASFGNPSNLIAYVCQLKRDGKVIAEGRGSANLKDHENSANATIKMAQISAFKDGVLRATGTSFLFTQDIENMTKKEIPKPKQEEHREEIEGTNAYDAYVESQNPLMTKKQENFLLQLVFEKVGNPETREMYLSQINGNLSRFDASELISSLLPMK